MAKNAADTGEQARPPVRPGEWLKQATCVVFFILFLVPSYGLLTSNPDTISISSVFKFCPSIVLLFVFLLWDSFSYLHLGIQNFDILTALALLSFFAGIGFIVTSVLIMDDKKSAYCANVGTFLLGNSFGMVTQQRLGHHKTATRSSKPDTEN